MGVSRVRSGGACELPSLVLVVVLMRCDRCGKEIPRGGSYFIKTLMIVCERCMGMGIEPHNHKQGISLGEIKLTPKPTYIPINQCDGCFRVLPIDKNGNHFDPDEPNRWVMGCEAYKYEEVK
jgi:hypothetical protein